MTIASIDMARSGNLGAALDESFARAGFAILQNPHLDLHLLDQVFDVSEAFFLSSTQDVFSRCGYQSAAENFGYQGVMEENLDPTRPADMKATFTMRNILNAPPAEDRWPSRHFRNVMMAFYAQALGLAHQLQSHIAAHFGVAPDYFSRHHSGDNVTLRLLYYPPVCEEELAAGQLGAGAHSDYGFMTLLFQRGQAGLEVLGADNDWMPVASEPHTIVLNSGDLLECWTHGAYRSTLHRVQPQTGHQPRFSIAFFVDPDSETLISPIPGLSTSQESADYPSIKAGDFIQNRLNASHKGRYGENA